MQPIPLLDGLNWVPIRALAVCLRQMKDAVYLTRMARGGQGKRMDLLTGLRVLCVLGMIGIPFVVHPTTQQDRLHRLHATLSLMMIEAMLLFASFGGALSGASIVFRSVSSALIIAGLCALLVVRSRLR